MLGLPVYLQKQLWVSSCVYLGQILCGYVSGWSSNVIIKLKDLNQTPLSEVMNDDESSLIASLTFLGLFGPYVAGYMSNTVGRIQCLTLAGVLGIISFALKVVAANKYMILVGRALVCQSAGIIFIMNLVYIAEISSTNIRGILLVGTGVSNSLGMAIAYAVGPYMTYRGTCYFGLAVAALYTVLACFLPESPTYYVLKGQEDKVRESLAALGRENEIMDILSTKIEESGVLEAWLEIFSVKSNRKAMFITVTLMAMQQMSGVMVVILFATSIFDLVHSSLQSHVSTIIIGATQLLASCITPMFVEKAGRRMLLLFTTAVCCLSLLALGNYFYLVHINHPGAESISLLPLISLITFLMSYNFGFGIIPGAFTGEMFDSKVRGPGSVFSITVSWAIGFAVSSTYNPMVRGWGSYTTFWIYSGVCASAFFFTLLFVPETKGKSLSEIQEMLSR